MASLKMLCGGYTDFEQGQLRRGLLERGASTCPPCLTGDNDTRPAQGGAESQPWLHPVPKVVLCFTREGLTVAPCPVVIHRWPCEDGLGDRVTRLSTHPGYAAVDGVPRRPPSPFQPCFPLSCMILFSTSISLLSLPIPKETRIHPKRQPCNSQHPWQVPYSSPPLCINLSSSYPNP